MDLNKTFVGGNFLNTGFEVILPPSSTKNIIGDTEIPKNIVGDTEIPKNKVGDTE